MSSSEPQLEALPEDWDRALVVVAHPDDPEYGAAAAVARWTSSGKDVRYVLATRGEAGIAGLHPDDSRPAREREQVASARVVGVQVVEFLDHADGTLVHGPGLRRDIARAVRRHRPELVLTLNHRETWAPGRWNSADHRALGTSVIDAVADAANEWIFPELTKEGHQPWSGVRWVAVASSPEPTHAVDVSAHTETAVAALSEHRLYLAALDDSPVEAQARRQIGWATAANPRFGDLPSVTFELFAQ